MKKTITQFVATALAAAAMLTFSSAFVVYAESISYIDENGVSKTADATDITAVAYEKDDDGADKEGEIKLEGGTYFVSGEVSRKKITVKDKVDIILMDNSQLTVPTIACDMSDMASMFENMTPGEDPEGGDPGEGTPGTGFDPENFDMEDMMDMFGNMKFLSGNLSIYGQSGQSGKLIMKGEETEESTETETSASGGMGTGTGMGGSGSSIGLTCDEININGGVIEIDNGKEDDGQEQSQMFNMGELMFTRFIVNSGKVTLKCKVAPFSMSSMMDMFSGMGGSGEGTEGGEGSGGSEGTGGGMEGMGDIMAMFGGDSSDSYVSLGCRTADDYIFVKECGESVRIASGQILQDGTGKEYTGILSDDEMSGIKNATFTLAANKNQYNVTVSDSEHGKVEAPAKAMEGSVVILTTTPDYGYVVDTITSDGPAVKDDEGIYTFEMPGKDVNVIPTFKKSVSSTFKKVKKPISVCYDVEENKTYVIFTLAPADGEELSDYDYIAAFEKASGDIIVPGEFDDAYMDENGKIYVVYNKIVFDGDESDSITAPEGKYYVGIVLDGQIELDLNLFEMKAVKPETAAES